MPRFEKAIAMHPMADAHLLNALARDESLRIERAVAMNASAAQRLPPKASFARQSKFRSKQLLSSNATVDQERCFDSISRAGFVYSPGIRAANPGATPEEH